MAVPDNKPWGPGRGEWDYQFSDRPVLPFPPASYLDDGTISLRTEAGSSLLTENDQPLLV